jgi:hypothetical protein
MDVSGRMIRMQSKFFYIRGTEMKYARFMMVNPNDSMIVMAHGLGPLLEIQELSDLRTPGKVFKTTFNIVCAAARVCS